MNRIIYNDGVEYIIRNKSHYLCETLHCGASIHLLIAKLRCDHNIFQMELNALKEQFLKQYYKIVLHDKFNYDVANYIFEFI